MSLDQRHTSPYTSKATPSERQKPLVTLALAAYNEASILEDNLNRLCNYLDQCHEQFYYEIVLINDGSKDTTGELADAFVKSHPAVRVFHHVTNQGLGKALQTAFAESRGDYVVTLDIDLSCSEHTIGELVSEIIKTKSTIVVASPYAKGGEMVKVPYMRKFLSIAANKFLSTVAPTHLTSLTCMVRVYEGDFIRSMNLRSMGMEIMPEIIYKATILNAKISEIPTVLDWSQQVDPNTTRRSSMRIFRHTFATLLTGFLLRPFLFIIFPGILLLLFSLYPITWMFIHFFHEFAAINSDASFLERSSQAIAMVFQLHPHTCLIGLLSLLLSVQLIAAGFQSLQNKHYFEEMFSLATEIRREKRK